jgi:hypothetical protein
MIRPTNNHGQIGFFCSILISAIIILFLSVKNIYSITFSLSAIVRKTTKEIY